MKLGVALIFFAALTQAKVPIEEKKTIDGLRGEIAKVREENARQKIENEELRKAIAKLRQADPMRQDDIVDAVKEIVDAKLAGYQKKSEAASTYLKKSEVSSQLTAYQTKSEAASTYLKKSQAADKIRSYLESHHICQAGTTWADPAYAKWTVSYSPAFPRKPTLSVALGGFRSKTLSAVGQSGEIKSYLPWNVVDKTASSFKITWSEEQKNIVNHGISWIACM